MGKFTLEIDTMQAGAVDGVGPLEIAAMLRDVATTLEREGLVEEDGGGIIGPFGNCIGSWRHDPSADYDAMESQALAEARQDDEGEDS